MKKSLSTLLFVTIILVGISAYWKTSTISPATDESSGGQISDRDAAIAEKAVAMNELIAHSQDGFIPNPAGYHSLWKLFYKLTLEGLTSRPFEHFRQTSSIFLPNGEKPKPPGATIPLPDEIQKYIELHKIPATASWHNLDSDVKVSGLDLKDKWNVPIRFSLRMDDSALNYLLTENLYNADGLRAISKPIDFPLSAIELKLSWIWIDTREKLDALQPEYYIAYAYYVDGEGQYQIGQAALTGFHLVPKVQRGWVWSTFENINNEKFTKAKYELPIDPEVEAANKHWQSLLKSEKSVFANYRLNGVQVSFVDKNEPVLLANSQIESYFQDNSSCKTCHHIAAYKSENGRLEFYNIVDTTGQGTKYFIGDPPDLTGWSGMDYAWSFKRAQWVRTR